MSVIGEILAEARRKGYINFGPGLPDPKTFPVEEIKGALSDLNATDLNYTPYDGTDELREALTKFLEKRGIKNRAIFVTSGAQEAIALVALYLGKHGMGVRVSNPAYLEALTAFRVHGVSVSPSDVDEEGEVPDVADAYYTIPTGHNPTGATMSEERRYEFASLSERVLIIEDGTYDMLYYDKPLKPIASLTDGSVYIFSFSKIISPGLRIGVLAVPEHMEDDLRKLRPALNICPSSVSQHVLLRLLERGVVERSAERAREVYREKRDVMVSELKDVADFVVPKAGFFVWVNLGRNAWQVLEEARRRGVVFIPGEPFFIVKPDPNYARLSFSLETPERIRDGVQILKEIL